VSDVFEALKREIRRRGLGARAVACKCHPPLAYNTTRRWLNGEVKCPRLDTLQRVADALGVGPIVMKGGVTTVADVHRQMATTRALRSRMALWLTER
jgi:hypothetical protein